MSLLADLVLAVHVLFAAFVVCGLAVIWIGWGRGWPLARHRRLRVLHLVAVLFVALEALIGMVCPLTAIEDLLRGRAPGELSFTARLLRAVLYYDFAPWVFTALYLALAAAALVAWRRMPPSPARRRPGT